VNTSLISRDLRRMDRHLAGEAVAAGFLAFAAAARRRCENRYRRCRSPAPARPPPGEAEAPRQADTARGNVRRGRGWLSAPSSTERSSAPQVSPFSRLLAAHVGAGEETSPARFQWRWR
jgi:hypothetical protein